MQASVQFHSNMRYGWSFDDFTERYAQSAMHRIEFTLTSEGMTALAERYPGQIIRDRHRYSDGKLVRHTMLLHFGENLFIQGLGNGIDEGEIIAPDAATGLKLWEEIRPILEAVKGPVKPVFHMLTYDGYEMATVEADNLPPEPSAAELVLTYGEDIQKWIAKFGKTTVARTGGFTLLEGPPGTGKTSLIMQFIRQLQETHVFYALPASQANAFAAAEFVPFWQRQHTLHNSKVKVIMVEDADGLLQSERRRAGDPLLAAMLNVADGLSGRLLRLHVLCTVNCKVSELEPAFLRPGRLLQHRRVDLLPADRAAALAAHRGLEWPPAKAKEEYSLAEVLNPTIATPLDPKRKAIGFGG